MRSCFLAILFCIIIPLSVNAQTGAINEEKFITIGGIPQWVTIKGDDSSRPVILFLHGGPGSTMSPYENTIYGAWEKEFVLVQWDQRGAGRTFGKNAPEHIDENYWIEHPLTVEQMSNDGIEFSRYLIGRFGKQKIIIIGTSWGSVMGATMALKAPALFYAYVGHSQIVFPAEGLVFSYHKVYAMAQAANDKESTEKLTAIGPPPYDDAKNAGQLFRIIKKYERLHSTPAPASWWKLAPQYDNATDDKNREDGDDYSFINYMGHKKMGIKPMAATINFLQNGLDFKLPVYIIQGEEDILTPKELTKPYFDKIKAPAKQFFLLPGAAHGHNQAVIDMQYKIVRTYIVPLINKR